MTDEKTMQETQNPTTEPEEELSEEARAEAFEAILFAAGYPVPYERLAETLGGSPEEMKDFAVEQAARYNAQPGRGVIMLALEDGAQLCTKSTYKSWIRQALGIHLSGRLSPSCMEVLAIIAYHQPVTKAYVEQVRGVDCSYAMGLLTDKSLIEPKERLDAPGRPFLYGTTADFLRCFGLNSLSELPENPLLKDIPQPLSAAQQQLPEEPAEAPTEEPTPVA